jgi:hypothetical protein
MVGDSVLVRLLVHSGRSRNQAIGFETLLDDRPIVGVSAANLSLAISRFLAQEDGLRAQARIELCEEIDSLRVLLNDTRSQLPLPWE